MAKKPPMPMPGMGGNPFATPMPMPMKGRPAKPSKPTKRTPKRKPTKRGK